MPNTNGVQIDGYYISDHSGDDVDAIVQQIKNIENPDNNGNFVKISSNSLTTEKLIIIEDIQKNGNSVLSGDRTTANIIVPEDISELTNTGKSGNIFYLSHLGDISPDQILVYKGNNRVVGGDTISNITAKIFNITYTYEKYLSTEWTAEDGEYVQTISLDGFTKDSNCTVALNIQPKTSIDEIKSISKAFDSIYAAENTETGIKFYAKKLPQAIIPIIIRGR